MAEIVAIVALAVLLAYREWVHFAERRELYQRIQAPERAVVDFAPTRPAREPVEIPVHAGPWGPPEEFDGE